MFGPQQPKGYGGSPMLRFINSPITRLGTYMAFGRSLERLQDRSLRRSTFAKAHIERVIQKLKSLSAFWIQKRGNCCRPRASISIKCVNY